MKFEDEFRPFVAQVGIPETVFSRPDIEIPTARYAELLETVAREANPCIGLEMGERLTLKDLGVVGHAMAATESIGEMLSVMSQYLYVFSHSNTMRLDVGENRAAFTYSVTILQPELIRQDVESALAYVTSRIRDLSGRSFSPSLVEFQHSKLKGAKRHHETFGCEVKFERPSNRLHFNMEVLRYPVLSSDPGLLKALRFYLDDKIKTRSEKEDLLAKTRHLISNSLSNRVPDQRWIAAQLGMSPRTLQRKLADKDIVFSELVDEIREAIALDYVRHSEYGLTDVAMMLGYGELSSFSRAFKRWTGQSPQQVRQGNE